MLFIGIKQSREGIGAGVECATRLIEEFLSIQMDRRWVCLLIAPFLGDCYTDISSNHYYMPSNIPTWLGGIWTLNSPSDHPPNRMVGG